MLMATTSVRAIARLDPPHFDAIREGTDITTWVTPA